MQRTYRPQLIVESENSAIISKQRISSKSRPIGHRNLSFPLTKSTTEDKKKYCKLTRTKIVGEIKTAIEKDVP